MLQCEKTEHTCINCTMSHTMENGVAIGIDFGTTFCRAAILDKGIQLLQNDEQERGTPVYLTFNEDGSAKLGDFVKKYFEQSVSQTLFGITHFMHKEPDQPSNYHSSSYDHEVRSLQSTNKRSRTELYAPFLKEMKQLAERHRDTAATQHSTEHVCVHTQGI